MQAWLTDFRELTAREITGFDCSFKSVISELVLQIEIMNISQVNVTEHPWS